MSRLDTTRIKELTNNRISYDIFLKEEEKKMKKIKKIEVITTICALFITFTITVDAETGGAISTPIKNAIKIKVDGEDKNATCTKKEDGSLNCKIDESVTGSDTEVIVDIMNAQEGNIEMEYNQESGELNTTIKD